MNKKHIVIILVLAIVIGISIGAVLALYTKDYTLPQDAIAPLPTATPNPVSATFTINGQPWSNNSPIHWNQLQWGDNTMPITVTNTGSVAIASVSISSTGLPAGWTETITMGSPTGATIPGIITLHADASVTGTQSWTSTITLTSP